MLSTPATNLVDFQRQSITHPLHFDTPVDASSSSSAQDIPLDTFAPLIQPTITTTATTTTTIMHVQSQSVGVAHLTMDTISIVTAPAAAAAPAGERKLGQLEPISVSFDITFVEPEIVVEYRRNPLDYPEILHVVGEHLPVFGANPNPNVQTYNNDLYFFPKDLLSCCLVSTLWRDVLLPRLWRVHDTKAMEKVPLEVIQRHSDLVRVCLGKTKIPSWNNSLAKNGKLVMHTQLVELNLESMFHEDQAFRLIMSNPKLRKLSMISIPLPAGMTQEISETAPTTPEGGVETVLVQGQNDGIVLKSLSHHFMALQELLLENIEVQRQDLWRILRPVAQNLRSLSLNRLRGTLDDLTLDDLIFEKLTHMTLSPSIPGLDELVGRAPLLEQLELKISLLDYPLETLVSILAGTELIETKKQREKRVKEGRTIKQWFRPQLDKLLVSSYPLASMAPHQATAAQRGIDVLKNNSRVLAMVMACSRQSDNNGIKWKPGCGQDGGSRKENVHLNVLHDNEAKFEIPRGIGHREKSLRSLQMSLHVLDNAAREAIESQEPTLEILHIIINNRGDRASPVSLDRQGRVFKELLRNCPKLRDVMIHDQNPDADVYLFVEDLVGTTHLGRTALYDANTVGDGNNILGINSEDVNNNGNSGCESDSGSSEDENPIRPKETVDRSQPWRSPALESLVIKAQFCHQTETALFSMKERRFTITPTATTARTGNNSSHSSSSAVNGENGLGPYEWVLPEQITNQNFNDGSETLLGEGWSGFDLFKEEEDMNDTGLQTGGSNGEEEDVLQRFLTMIEPSRRLRKLQLGQLKFER